MFEIIERFFPLQLKGAGYTVSIALFSVVFGIILGMLLALGRISKVGDQPAPVRALKIALRSFCKLYIWFVRGTPLLLQIFFFYYAMPTIIPAFNIKSPFIVAIIAFSLNSAAYLAEIFRAAIESIDKGQMEAARALGMTYRQGMRRIIIPQSIRRMVPPVGNEVVTLLKDTSLVSAMGFTELMRVTTQVQTRYGDATIYLSAIALYLAMTTLLTFVFNKIEKKNSIYE